MKLWRRYRLFLRGLATNWVGALGAVLTTSAFLLFLFVLALQLLGVITNAYVGLISYLLLPALFLLGLALVPWGWHLYRRRTGRPTRELLDERFAPELTRTGPFGSGLLGLVLLLTLVNLFFLGAGGARILHFMDEPRFCGTACHQVMHPEWITYQRSPHAHVKCVECHVGEGADALIDAKINGLWQVISATFDLYERPIPTPVHTLRPARETCEQCHWPDVFYGDRFQFRTRYGFDRASTPEYTTLLLHVGSGAQPEKRTIHWHVASENEVRYRADSAREEMQWVEVRRADGSYHRYTRRDVQQTGEAAAVRALDCVDCHNRVTHIYEDPEVAVDRRMHSLPLDRRLPFLKREGLGLLLAGWGSKTQAYAGIERGLSGYYARFQRRETDGLQPEIARAVDALQDAYRRNIHPRMQVGWNPYPDHRGHAGGGGCFRCHNRELVDAAGKSIGYDCTRCHGILALESTTPFAYLEPAPEQGRERALHRYLRQDFLAVRGAAAPRAGGIPLPLELHEGVSDSGRTAP